MTPAQSSSAHEVPHAGARLHALILAGGAGTRLWPLSRQELPKQFMAAFDGQSLFERTVLRCQGLAPNKSVRDVCIQVLGSVEHRFLLSEQLADVGASAKVWLEPLPRGTAASVALALQDLPEDDLVLVCPSDHHIPDLETQRKERAQGYNVWREKPCGAPAAAEDAETPWEACTLKEAASIPSAKLAAP
jgi:mannose-1-phosphate guanylyltransferase